MTPSLPPSSDPALPHAELTAESEPVLAAPGGAVVPASRFARAKSVTYAVLGRSAYWGPVLVVVVLFAQISFLGLRPALCESQRLSEAEQVLLARHADATATNHAIAAQLGARADPIFIERQRRLRTIR
jgi:hypothetical protein